VIVSTDRLYEPFQTISPVYTVITNRGRVLDDAAKALGIDVRSFSGADLLSGLVMGDSVADYRLFPIAFTVCVEALKRGAAARGANAVIGLRMNFDLDKGGSGLQFFTMQLFGTAVRRHE
jgi:uncharacterized protein YbjQ (UPF0145 family)